MRAAEHQTDERLGRIISVLMNYSTTVISGTKLAQEIGTTRSEVWRLVQQLRTFGVEIAGHPSSGYQLTAVPDLLLAELLQPLAIAVMGGLAFALMLSLVVTPSVYAMIHERRLT